MRLRRAEAARRLAARAVAAREVESTSGASMQSLCFCCPILGIPSRCTCSRMPAGRPFLPSGTTHGHRQLRPTGATTASTASFPLRYFRCENTGSAWDASGRTVRAQRSSPPLPRLSAARGERTLCVGRCILRPVGTANCRRILDGPTLTASRACSKIRALQSRAADPDLLTSSEVGRAVERDEAFHTTFSNPVLHTRTAPRQSPRSDLSSLQSGSATLGARVT